MYTRNSERFRHFRAHGSQWGPGKVHVQVYAKKHAMLDRKSGRWLTLCRYQTEVTDPLGLQVIFGEEATNRDTVTCRKCRKAMDDLGLELPK